METKPKLHFAPSYFHTLTHKITITIIGCGGTGSFVLSKLARLDYAMKELGMPGLHVIAYDYDIVESHNVGRQNFTIIDIGKNKALRAIEKINMAFGLQWEAMPVMVKDFLKVKQSNFLITAVDNIAVRNSVEKYFKKYRNTKLHRTDYNTIFYWIDAGNGKDFGQVILTTTYDVPQPESTIYTTVPRLKSIIERYGNLSKFDNENTQGMLSCSMEESLSKQDLYINDTVSVYVVGIIWNLIRHFRIAYSGVIINQATFATKPLEL